MRLEREIVGIGAWRSQTPMPRLTGFHMHAGENAHVTGVVGT